MVALEKGSVDMFKCILKHDVDINHRGASDTTALHIALEKGSLPPSPSPSLSLSIHTYMCK